jgi:biotin operon repressor
MKDYKDELLEVLQENPERYMTGHLLAETIGLPNVVELRKLVNELRRMGIPIVANSKGYKYTVDEQEIIIYCASLRSRAQDMMAAYDGLFRMMLINRNHNGL